MEESTLEKHSRISRRPEYKRVSPSERLINAFPRRDALRQLRKGRQKHVWRDKYLLLSAPFSSSFPFHIALLGRVTEKLAFPSGEFYNLQAPGIILEFCHCKVALNFSTNIILLKIPLLPSAKISRREADTSPSHLLRCPMGKLGWNILLCRWSFTSRS